MVDKEDKGGKGGGQKRYPALLISHAKPPPLSAGYSTGKHLYDFLIICYILSVLSYTSIVTEKTVHFVNCLVNQVHC